MSDIDWGRSGRRDSYDFYLVNPFTLQENGEIEVDAADSSLTWGYGTENILSGSLTAVNSTSRDNLIRVKHTISFPDGYEYNHTLGTLFVDNSGNSAKFKKVLRSLDCYSTLWRFTQDCLVEDYYKPAGTNVVEALNEFVNWDGGMLLLGTNVNNSSTLASDIWHEIETNRAEVMRDLATRMGCEINVSPEGFIVVDGYIPVMNRPVSYTFEAGSNCNYLPGVEMTDSTEGAVNRVVAYYSTDNATDRAMVDLEYFEPFSYNVIGRRVSKFLKVDSPVSNDELYNLAFNYLHANKGTTQFFEIEHVYIPDVQIGKLVRYINQSDFETPIDSICLVEQMDMTLGPGGMCKTKLRVVR